MRYVPLSNKPTLPIKFAESYDYVKVAWHVYWQMCKKLQKKQNYSLLEAHQSLQSKYPFTLPEGIEKLTTEDRILLFMWQFKKWQLKSYDLEKIKSGGSNLTSSINIHTTAEEAFEYCGDANRSEIICELWCRDCWEVVHKFINDPIFGEEARSEIENYEWRRQHEIDEVFRISALPPNITKIYESIKILGPSIYNVFFPYPKNQFHSVENCLCLMADGSVLFRLEVLDPETCTKFKLAELMPPWWKETGLLEACQPGEGEYDFPFYDFNIKEGDEFNLEKLMEVIEYGASQIGTRSLRKWGIS